MVNLSTITTNNDALRNSSARHVAVFVGGTAGIGKLTLAEMSDLGMNLKVYVIGRKSSYAAFKAHSDALCAKNPDTEIVWIEGEVSLLAEVKRVCGEIKKREERVDLLFMTTGYAPFGGRESTSHNILSYRAWC
jgi:NADP-dependent 3-hydroxy acid dehydrogenase YdfG